MEHRICILAVALVVLSSIHSLASSAKLDSSKELPNVKHTYNPRYTRAVRKPGFFRTLFSVIYEQWVDGKDTADSIRKMLNENIVDDSRTTTTTPSSNPNASTSAAPYVLTRSELTRIINRNVKGLVRLYNLEINDALQASYKNNAEYRKNVSAEISKYL